MSASREGGTPSQDDLRQEQGQSKSKSKKGKSDLQKQQGKNIDPSPLKFNAGNCQRLTRKTLKQISTFLAFEKKEEERSSSEKKLCSSSSQLQAFINLLQIMKANEGRMPPKNDFPAYQNYFCLHLSFLILMSKEDDSQYYINCAAEAEQIDNLKSMYTLEIKTTALKRGDAKKWKIFLFYDEENKAVSCVVRDLKGDPHRVLLKDFAQKDLEPPLNIEFIKETILKILLKTHRMEELPISCVGYNKFFSNAKKTLKESLKDKTNFIEVAIYEFTKMNSKIAWDAFADFCIRERLLNKKELSSFIESHKDDLPDFMTDWMSKQRKSRLSIFSRLISPKSEKGNVPSSSSDPESKGIIFLSTLEKKFTPDLLGAAQRGEFRYEENLRQKVLESHERTDVLIKLQEGEGEKQVKKWREDDEEKAWQEWQKKEEERKKEQQGQEEKKEQQGQEEKKEQQGQEWKPESVRYTDLGKARESGAYRSKFQQFILGQVRKEKVTPMPPSTPSDRDFIRSPQSSGVPPQSGFSIIVSPPSVTSIGSISSPSSAPGAPKLDSISGPQSAAPQQSSIMSPQRVTSPPSVTSPSSVATPSPSGVVPSSSPRLAWGEGRIRQEEDLLLQPSRTNKPK